MVREPHLPAPTPQQTPRRLRLWILARQSGKVVPRNEIYEEIQGIKYDGLDRSIDLQPFAANLQLDFFASLAANIA